MTAVVILAFITEFLVERGLPSNFHDLVVFWGCVAAAYVFFRGICVIINNSCCWIIEKLDEGDEPLDQE